VPRSVFSPAYAILLEELIAARKTAKLTQGELAARLGRPQPFMSYVERGERRVDVIEFCAIAHAIGCKPEALFARVVARLPEKLEI